jgi:2-polyprenyl-6-methoxyphenol hydroxylase-like FAD-dependent oxidoreductase
MPLALDCIIVGKSVSGLINASLMSRLPFVRNVLIIEEATSLRDAEWSTGLWSSALAVLFNVGVRLNNVKNQHIAQSGFTDAAGRILMKPYTEMKSFSISNVNAASLHFITNDLLLSSLEDSIDKHKVKIINDKVIHVQREDAGVSVQCLTGDEYKGDLIIAADGMFSSIRNQLFGPHSSFLRKRGYQVYSGYSKEEGIKPTFSFQGWADGKRFALVPTTCGYQWFATIPYVSNPKGTFHMAKSSGPLTANMEYATQDEMKGLDSAFQEWSDNIRNIITSSMSREEKVRHCEAVAFQKVFHRGNSNLFQYSDVLLMGEAGFALDPILAQGAGLSVEEALLYYDSLLLAYYGADTRDSGALARMNKYKEHAIRVKSKRELLDMAMELYEKRVRERRERLFMLSNISQFFGTMEKGVLSTIRDKVLMYVLPEAAKGALFDIFIQISNKNKHL